MDNNLYICNNCKAHWIGKQLCTCSMFNQLIETKQELNRKHAKNFQTLSEQEVILRYFQGIFSIYDKFVNVSNPVKCIEIVNGCLTKTKFRNKGFVKYNKIELKPLKEYDDDRTTYRWEREK